MIAPEIKFFWFHSFEITQSSPDPPQVQLPIWTHPGSTSLRDLFPDCFANGQSKRDLVIVLVFLVRLHSNKLIYNSNGTQTPTQTPHNLALLANMFLEFLSELSIIFRSFLISPWLFILPFLFLPLLPFDILHTWIFKNTLVRMFTKSRKAPTTSSLLATKFIEVEGKQARYRIVESPPSNRQNRGMNGALFHLAFS